MGRAERLYAIDRLLRERGGLGLDEFMAALEVSRTTFRRDLDYLRDRLHAPIVWDAGERKYRFSSDPASFKSYALPGVWLLSRRVLRVTHYNRHTDETLTREISPQRLIYYRDNWYLDSWCHLRGDLRSFAVDAMRAVMAVPKAAIEIPGAKVSERFDAGYGVFSGTTTEWAKLRFSAYRARWIANEVWHRDQKGTLSYSLEIPFNDPRELIADILRQGAECEVVQPEALRNCLAAEVARLHTLYAKSK